MEQQPQSGRRWAGAAILFAIAAAVALG